MIVQSEELTPNQKAAIEEILGRQLVEREAVSVSTFQSPVMSETKEQAREELLKFLQSPRHPRPGVSDEELEEAITEAMRSVRPSYTPVK